MMARESFEAGAVILDIAVVVGVVWLEIQSSNLVFRRCDTRYGHETGCVVAGKKKLS
jgi:hypothetical protein